MSGTKTTAKTVKRSVSFSVLVNQWAEELAEEGGYDNFSAFIQDLVRNAKKHHRDVKKTPKESASEILAAATRRIR